jgi:hypothetical protein
MTKTYQQYLIISEKIRTFVHSRTGTRNKGLVGGMVIRKGTLP